MINARFYDVVSPDKKNVKTKSGDEVVADFVERAGLKIV